MWILSKASYWISLLKLLSKCTLRIFFIDLEHAACGTSISCGHQFVFCLLHFESNTLIMVWEKQWKMLELLACTRMHTQLLSSSSPALPQSLFLFQACHPGCKWCWLFKGEGKGRMFRDWPAVLSWLSVFASSALRCTSGLTFSCHFCCFPSQCEEAGRIY